MEAMALAGRGTKKRTGYLDENREYAPATIENPYQPGTFQAAVVNRRESNARTLRLGPAQAEAYNRVWALYYKAGYHRQGAVDPSNEPVDCSRSADPLPLSVAEANSRLNQLRSEIGEEWWVFIELTCKHGYGYREIAAMKLGCEPGRGDLDETVFQVKTAWNRATVKLGLSGAPSWFARLRGYMSGERSGFDGWEESTSAVNETDTGT